MEHMRPNLRRITPRPGDALVTNRRRPLLELVEDTSPGVHDTLIASCDLRRYAELGHDGPHDNCTDNLRAALGQLDVRTGECPAPPNLWMNIPVKPDYTVEWLPPVSKAGDYVEIRADMDVIVVMSACPQDIVPINDLNPVEVTFSVHG